MASEMERWQAAVSGEDVVFMACLFGGDDLDALDFLASAYYGEPDEGLSTRDRRRRLRGALYRALRVASEVEAERLRFWPT